MSLFMKLLLLNQFSSLFLNGRSSKPSNQAAKNRQKWRKYMIYFIKKNIYMIPYSEMVFISIKNK